MDRKAARQEIRGSWKQILPTLTKPARMKVNGETSYICPICGNGAGKDGDGLTRNPKSIDGNGLKCFKCGFSGDIIDLYQQVKNTDYNTAFSLLASELNIVVDPYFKISQQSNFKKQRATDISQTEKSAVKEKTDSIQNKIDYMRYYQKCRQRLKNDPIPAKYLKGRGISLNTATAYWLGYDPESDPAGAPGGNGEIRYPTRRIIIPTSKRHYTGRAIDADVPQKFQKLNAKGSAPGIFNKRVLYSKNVQTIFITEGPFDALSFLEVGFPALAINSTSNINALIKQLREKRTTATLIISLDNDEAGKKATDTLERELKQLNINFITANICEKKYKDPNEFLQKDKNSFVATAREAQQIATKPDNTYFYTKSKIYKEIQSFKSGIKTGFSNLDEESGGLYTGLYVLGAVPSLGKTTFLLQLADQIAASGEDVLYFSLEQSRLEIVTKSLSRIIAQREGINHTMTSLAIREGNLSQSVQEAITEYQKTIGDRISIVESDLSCDLSFIGTYISEFISKNNVKPVVIVDYLQLLQPEEASRKQSTKEAVDCSVTGLKKLSRKYGITILVVSSLNRSNYLLPISFESFKESGNIEYTADCILGLQLHCLKDSTFDSQVEKKREKIEEAKAKNPRMIDLECLKNRFGKSNYSCSFKYYPANDFFVPASNFSENEMPKKANRRIGS